MAKPARKPLRRTAWGMLLGGLAVAALMVGVGLYVVSKGEPAGPGQSATWPGGADISVSRPFGPQQGGGDAHSVVCTVTPERGQPMPTRLTWGERNHPNFTGSATITCEQPVRVLTGPAIAIAGNTRGPLLMVPLFVAILGILFFFPRFTAIWASHSRPFSALFTRSTGRDRRDFI